MMNTQQTKMTTFLIVLAISMVALAMAAPQQALDATPSCGPDETLVAVGGGCFTGADGVQQCLPAKAPTCECSAGFQRNLTTKKCERSVTSIRIGRSLSDAQKNCSGPNEHLVATGGGCYVDETGKQICLPAKPPTCVCVSGFERNPANKLCEAVNAVTKTKL